ncbi:MAG: LUD domain-containing protein [Planctomycetaceae bacterium]|nr:LUD domain-containing protein [Planctomycetaceae bacterium]
MSAASSAREQILSNLRAALPQSSPLPELPATGPWQTFADPLERFSEVLATVGGQCVQVSSRRQAHEILTGFPEWQAARVRISAVDGVGESNTDVSPERDPHDYETVDFAVLPGHFGVAENAAIWVTDDLVPHRVLYFIPQRLAMVIPSSEIVNNMHEAYGRISVGRHAFAGFISGPSKTADIEQSLVIGAHGARSLTVFAVDEL